MSSAARALATVVQLRQELNAPDGRMNLGEIKALVAIATAYLEAAVEGEEVDALVRDMEGTTAALAEAKARNVPKDAALHILAAARRVA